MLTWPILTLSIVLILTSVVLAMFVLLHKGRGGGMSDLFGGGMSTSMGGSSAAERTLDRLVALDTMVAVTMCAIGTWAAYSLDTTVTYSLAALALISFVGSVSIARFRVPDIDEKEQPR